MNGRKAASGPSPQGMQLHDAEGRRLYLTDVERRAFIAAAAQAPREVRTFCGVLHAIGCRISEALGLTAERIDLAGRVIVFESLKKRRKGTVNLCRHGRGIDLILKIFAISGRQYLNIKLSVDGKQEGHYRSYP